jgi:hypothetical protein
MASEYTNLFWEHEELPTHREDNSSNEVNVYICPATLDLFATLTEEKK